MLRGCRPIGEEEEMLGGRCPIAEKRYSEEAGFEGERG